MFGISVFIFFVILTALCVFFITQSLMSKKLIKIEQLRHDVVDIYELTPLTQKFMINQVIEANVYIKIRQTGLTWGKYSAWYCPNVWNSVAMIEIPKKKEGIEIRGWENKCPKERLDFLQSLKGAFDT